MIACLLCVLLLGVPLFQILAPPAIVTASGPLTGIDVIPPTLHMRCDGRERSFFLPEGTKITINDKPNCTLADFGKFSMGRKPRCRITIVSDGLTQTAELIVVHD